MSEIDLSQEVGSALKNAGITLACAESCTGGLLLSRLTDIPGSSSYLLGGIVSYSVEMKVNFLGVKRETIAKDGVVSAAVAREMAEGICKAAKSDIGVGITGLAGPGGGTAEQPVGLVYIAVTRAGTTAVTRNLFSGSRREIKYKSTEKALTMLKEILAGKA